MGASILGSVLMVVFCVQKFSDFTRMLTIAYKDHTVLLFPLRLKSLYIFFFYLVSLKVTQYLQRATFVDYYYYFWPKQRFAKNLTFPQKMKEKSYHGDFNLLKS